MGPYVLKRMSCCASIALFFLLAGTAAADAGKPQTEMRCGWFSNPSPNNASLTDRDGEWMIAAQGQFDAKGEWPEFKKSQWVPSGTGSYGYGCACMRVVTDKDEHRITDIVSSTVKPLTACRRDRKLPALKHRDD